MDIDLEKNLREYVDYLRQYAVGDIDYAHMDPIAKMMLVALLHEGQNIRDYIDSTPQKVTERYCSHFIPYEQVGAMPAVAVLAPEFKPRKDADIVSVGAGTTFTYKLPDSKQQLDYIPMFATSLVPHSDLFVVTPRRMTSSQGVRPVAMGVANRLWVGIVGKCEIECLQGLSLLIRGTDGLLPERLVVGQDQQELDIASMHEMENLEMLPPFDAQQSSGQFFAITEGWEECLLNMDNAALLYVTDTLRDRDLFKPRAYPKVFQQWLEDEALDCFDPATLWLRLDFPEGYVLPEDCTVQINVLPVTNVDLNTVTLTQSQPIAKLQKQDDSFFLRIVETSSDHQKQGFSPNSDEILVRDFDANSYDNADLYRDVRTLYNRFIDDYHAFTRYNDIKDGEVLRRLRETINRMGKSVGETNEAYMFDSGTYVMRNMSNDTDSSTIRVSFITTQGRQGNAPQAGQLMENKCLPSVEQKVSVAVAAMGGQDKATVDQRYELLRYYALTNDRLYTRQDVDAFLRKEMMAEFGKAEFHRIFIRISVQGAGGPVTLRRGLYIDLEFKDRKNYDRACQQALDKMLQQKIRNKSCIAMPIIINLKNLEG